MMAESPSVPELSRVEISPESRCPGCRADLALHQPDADLPDRLIATCRACHAWFLIYSELGVHFRLPNEDEVQPL
jgi:hypothetical protein